MFTKLLKYELKSSARTLLPLYLGILVVSVFCGFFVADGLGGMSGWLSDSFLGGVIVLLLFALYVAMGVLTVVSIVGRFNSSLLGDEGFLMFTLPVSTTMLLSSKLMTAMIWCFCGGLVGILSTLIMGLVTALLNLEYFNLMEIWESFVMAINYWTGEQVIYVFEMILLSFVAMAGVILTAYLAMMIGQLQRFSRHRVAVSFLAFFLISWAFSWLGEPIAQLWYSLEIFSFGANLHFTFLAQILQTVVVFLGVDYLMKKYLNL